MNILITLAGKSLRFFSEGFTKDKFLLELDKNEIVLDKVVEMFNPDDTFHFIISKTQSKIRGLKKKIIKTTKKNFIHIIKDHDKGPVYSVLKIKNINENEPIIISYCDFFVRWDYKRFLRNIHDLDGSIPVFRGFHPSSFSGTLYAYVKTNNKKFLSIREKKSFTKNHINEYASCGIYYFKNFKMFKKFGSSLVKKSIKESYVSLIYNLMQKSNLHINVFEVQKFICLGTPFDYQSFLFWKNYFNKNLNFSTTKMFSGANLIPMSGEGKRFKKYGYRVTKPLIEVNNKPMILNVCKTFPKSKNWNFIINNNDDKNNRIENLIKKIDLKSNIIRVKKITNGPAESCYFAKNKINENDPLFISSCDYLTIFNQKNWQKIIKNKKIDGAIWTFKLENLIVKSFKAFGYCKVYNNIVNKIVEKNTLSNNPKSDNMMIGSFWFRKAKSFFQSFEESKKKKFMINNEYYVGNNINLLIRKKMKFVIFEVDQWISLGDPFELKVFEYWKSIFKK